MSEDAPKAWYRELHWQILAGLLLGFLFAIGVRQWFLSSQDLETLATLRAPFGFLGDLFMRALKLIVIPLVVVSVVTGIQRLGDASELGRIGLRTIAYYMLTTLAAVVIGLLLVNIVQPGVGLGLEIPGETALKPKPFLDVLRDIIPSNIFGALANGDMLPTIFASVLFGLALLTVGEKGQPIRDLLESVNEVVFKVTDWVMATAPVGVGALFAFALTDPKLADLTTFFENLFGYFMTVVAGLSIHAVLVLPVLYFVATRRNPLRYAQALSPALLTAFSTASSSATYPLTLECVTDRADVDKKTADFVLPLGATINMDGTALYEAVAAVFIANALGIDLTFTAQLIIVLTATLAAIGAAGVPSAGLVTMIIVLESVGLPASGFLLVMSVDRILDQFRTTVNVWGDSIGAAVVAHYVEAKPDA